MAGQTPKRRAGAEECPILTALSGDHPALLRPLQVDKDELPLALAACTQDPPEPAARASVEIPRAVVKGQQKVAKPR